MSTLVPSPQPSPRLLRLPAVKAKTGCSKTLLYTLISRGEFPSPLPLSAHSVAWLESEVDDWIQARRILRDARSGSLQATTR